MQISYPFSGHAYAQWDRAPRHIADQARQIETALEARRWATALWACYAIRDEAAKAEWAKRIEEARIS